MRNEIVKNTLDTIAEVRQIASHAECHDEHASIARVNIWRGGSLL